MNPSRLTMRSDNLEARWEHGLRRELHYARFRSRRAYQLDQQVQANVAAYWRQLLSQSIQESQAA